LMQKPDLTVYSELPLVKTPRAMTEQELRESPITKEPHSLLQRIVAEEDAKPMPAPVTKKEAETKVEKPKPAEGDLKRYYVEIVCSGIIVKPKFQIFKGPDIMVTDFKTDAVLRQETIFAAVVDATRQSEIQEVVVLHFANAYVSKAE